MRARMLAGSAVVPVIWALLPAAEYLLRTRTDIRIDQLLGRGCQFQEPLIGIHSLNPLTTAAIRNPEYACPIWAAENLAVMRHSPDDRTRLLRAFDQALLSLPATFDTGDGVIPYAAKLQAARAAI